jgi:two-component system, NarL family, nitrate/nitrite response regulator NarL
MPIRVLLADDSDIIRGAIMRVLSEEPGIELVGEGANFADAIQLTAALKPDVLLLDLHMPDENEYSPELVKSQILPHNVCILAISVWNDEKARALAESFGAKVFLDKTSLYTTLVPAIKEHCLKRKATTA